MRDEVQRFAEVMERELKANDHKGGWKDCSLDWLFAELETHLKRLRANAYGSHILHTLADRVGPEAGPPTRTLEYVLDDAADVANFAMMIADISRALAPPK